MASTQFSQIRCAPRRNRPEGLALEGAERWYVVRSLPRQEAKARFHLLEQGFSAFLPMMTKTVRHARQSRTVRSAVFPSYMFVALDLGRDRWRSVNGTYGVASLIMTHGAPEAVPVGVVEQLIGYLDDDGVVRFDRDLREGQSVRVASGPFANAIGRLERLDANGRVRVLLDLMGGKVPALLERSALEAA
jgi:transcription elongation factor/antiterminator RfaH